MTTLHHDQQTLAAASEVYAVLPIGEGSAALITQRGGRVLGVFPAEDAPNLLWTNRAALSDAAAQRAFAEAGAWNLGGERLWIAPEIQYNVRNRADFWGTLHVPTAMDPAAYTLEADGGQVTLRAQMALDAYNLATGTQQLSVERVYQPVPNPLPRATRAGVVYGGYEQRVTLRATQPDIPAEAWNLIQLPAGGELIILSLPEVEAVDYFGSVPAAARMVHTEGTPHVRLALTGRQQFKVGYRAWCMIGRMGYWRTLPDGRAALLVRAFFNNPSNPYAEEPPAAVGERGFSVHVYNDGGEFGGDQSFGEMECSGTTLIHGRTEAVDTFLLWAYVGPAEDLKVIGRLLLGVAL